MRIVPLLASLMLIAPSLAAHEFWISPQHYMIDVEDQLLADIRVGENFKGSASAYLPPRFERFDIVTADGVAPVEGRVGDRPALSVAPGTEGLKIIVHQTSDMTLTYRDMVKFSNFVKHKDFAWALEEHKKRGLPEKGFKERYSRYGKSLVSVGNGRGQDQEVGLLTEIVAGMNPYAQDASGGMPVRVYYQGKPRADVQVELFERAPDGKVAIALFRTDADGTAVLPVKPGHEYLVDSVVMRAITPETPNGPVWESLWASLTFKIPQ